MTENEILAAMKAHSVQLHSGEEYYWMNQPPDIDYELVEYTTYQDIEPALYYYREHGMPTKPVVFDYREHYGDVAPYLFIVDLHKKIVDQLI